MKSLTRLAAAFALLAPLPALADVVFCDAQDSRAMIRYYTPFVEIPPDGTRQLTEDFEDYLKAEHPGSRLSAGCWREDTLSRAESRLGTFKVNNEQFDWIDTGFTGGRPLASAATKAPDAGSGRALTVKSTETPPPPKTRQQEQRELEARRAREEEAARAAANRIQADALYAAALKAERERRQRCPSRMCQ